MEKLTWVSISKAAKILDRGLNGVRFHLGRSVRGKKVKKGNRLVWRVCKQDLIKLAPSLTPRKFKKHPCVSRRKCSRTGYILMYMPRHPRAMSDGHIYEHWLVMENQLGRFLKSKETVHHKNRIRHDNRIENLHLYASRAEHMKEAHSEENRQILLNLRRD